MSLRPREHGYVVVTSWDADKPVFEGATLQCCHCGGHFPAHERKGRGWCHNCAAPICGAGCLECVPEEVYLESLEKGIPTSLVLRWTPAGW